MPFFNGASGTVANYGKFNDVTGNQYNWDGDRHFAGDNHDYYGPVDRGDHYNAEIRGGVVGGTGNHNNFSSPSQRTPPTSTPQHPSFTAPQATDDDDDDDDDLLKAQVALLRAQRELKRSQQRANQLATELAATKAELASVRAELARFKN